MLGGEREGAWIPKYYLHFNSGSDCVTFSTNTVNVLNVCGARKTTTTTMRLLLYAAALATRIRQIHLHINAFYNQRFPRNPQSSLNL